MLGLGLGLNRGGIKRSLLSTNIAVAHQLRILAVDANSVLPIGVSTLAAYIQTAIDAAATGGTPTVITTTAEFNTFYPIFADPHITGYLMGAGSGETLGQAIKNLYSINPSSDYTKTTATSQPLLLSWDSTVGNYFYTGAGNDVVGAFCQTSTNVSPQINTDFTFEFNFSGFTSRGVLGGCPSLAVDGWSLQIQAGTNILRFYGRVASVNVLTIESTVGISVTGNRWIKVVRSGNNYSFWEKADGGTYTQVGATVIDATPLVAITSTIQVGNGFNTNYLGIGCNIISANFYSDATSTTLVSTFNPNSYNIATSQTQWTSTTSEVWTINTGSASTGYKGCIVSRTLMQSDGVNDKLETTITLANNHTNYTAYKALVQDGSGNRIIYSNGTTNFNNVIASFSTNNVFVSLTSALFAVQGAKVFQTLGMTTTVFGTNATRNKVNNGTFSSAITGAYVGGAGHILFGSPSVHFANSQISTVVVSSINNSSAQNTAIYSMISQFNQGGF
jgi:hypothetical protein